MVPPSQVRQPQEPALFVAREVWSVKGLARIVGLLLVKLSLVATTRGIGNL